MKIHLDATHFIFSGLAYAIGYLVSIIIDGHLGNMFLAGLLGNIIGSGLILAFYKYTRS